MFARIGSILTLRRLPHFWRVAIYICVGIAIGLAVVVARIANAMSYLSEAPETCINCHVMTDAYATWQRGSHGRVAVCVDCHLPQGNIVAKYAFKAMDGAKDSYVFAMRGESQVLQLSETAGSVVQSNCQRCHGELFSMIRMAESSQRKCWDCHTNIHGEVHSLSSSPRVLRPQLPDAGLEWMK